MKSKHFFFLILYFISLISFAQDAGYLDESFGENGIVITTPYNLSSIGNAVAVHGDGKIVMGGTLSDSGDKDFVFAQYLQDGSLDESFSDDGMLRLNFPGSYDYINDVVIQEDEKILAVGVTATTTSSDFAVVRLNEDGSLDNSFSSNGMTVVGFGEFDYGRSITLQEDGKIIVAGYTKSGDNNFDLAMCRLNENGTLDATFGNNGKVIYDVNWESEDLMNCVVVYAGNIFVSGYIYDTFNGRTGEGVAVVKFDEEGHVVNDFGEQGLAYFMLDVTDQIIIPGSKMAVNQNGIYVATRRVESGNTDMAIINFLHNGYPNSDFGDQGIVITEMVVNSNATCIALQSDNKIVVGGDVSNTKSGKDSFVARFLVNGIMDSEFGENYGVTIVDINPGAQDGFNSLCIDSDSKIVAGGTAFLSDDYFVLARFYSGLEVGVTETNMDNSFNPHIKNPVVSHQLDMTVEFIETSEVEARLFDMEGRDAGFELHETFKVGTHRLVYDLRPDLPRGIYLLQMTVNGQRKSFRLLIQ